MGVDVNVELRESAAEPINPLLAAVERQLCALAVGDSITEFELLQSLQQLGLVAGDYADSNLSLFQTHFLLHNALYQSHRRWQRLGERLLAISSVRISILSACERGSTESEGSTELVASGGANAVIDTGLRDYYLNWDNLMGESEASVTQLLEGFWRRYWAQDKRAGALQLLQLPASASMAEIKRQYRRLAMQWHPDRGGDDGRFQQLNEAMQILEACEG